MRDRERIERKIKRAIDSWAVDNGHGVTPEHEEIAARVYLAIEANLRLPLNLEQALLVDYEGDRYTRVRLVESAGEAIADLYPEDPETGECAEEAVAHGVIYLPKPSLLPEIDG